MSNVESQTPSSEWVLDRTVAQLVRRKALQLSKSHGFSRSDRLDIEQELYMHLLRKTANYDPARAKAATFAKRLIENKAASLVRKVRAQKCDRRRNVLSLNESMHEDGRSIERAETFADSAGRRHTGQRCPRADELTQLRNDVTDTSRRLPPELRMYSALISHVSQFAAAQVLGISRRQAAVYVATLRAIYEERGLAM